MKLNKKSLAVICSLGIVLSGCAGGPLIKASFDEEAGEVVYTERKPEERFGIASPLFKGINMFWDGIFMTGDYYEGDAEKYEASGW